jgi:hypothetical protein
MKHRRTGLEIATDLEKLWEDLPYDYKCYVLRVCPECGEPLRVLKFFQLFQEPHNALSCGKCGFYAGIEINEHNREHFTIGRAPGIGTTGRRPKKTPPPLKKTSFTKGR